MIINTDKKRLLYIGQRRYDRLSGAAQVNIRNIRCLEKIFGENMDFIEPEDSRKFFLYRWGGNRGFREELRKRLSETSYDYAFISQSLLGDVARIIKETAPDTKIVTFFHNIEVQYAREFVRTSGVTHIPFYIAAGMAEKNAVRYSDYYIVLNDRDAELLHRIYHVSPSLILPTSFEDSFDEKKATEVPNKDNGVVQYLFVGSAFFANIEGLGWFIKKVLPYVPGRLVVVGNGMDGYRSVWKDSRVEVHGFVEDLSDFYYTSDIVVSPIFSGGGMKTKIAEALMFGKTIIGTDEALTGYVREPKSMLLCNTAEEFIKSIDRMIGESRICKYNQISRRIFKDNYSYQASLGLLEKFFMS